MRFRPSREDDPELNLVPLIDVMLMTLIFLVVTTSFSKETQLRIRLPEASVEAKTDPVGLRIMIDAKGQYFINDQQLLNASLEVLRNAMSRSAAGDKNPVVIIHADAKTPHEAVIRVMDAARRLGFTQLTFATQQPISGPPAP